MINRVVLTGRLTRDPELKFTNSGLAVARFTVAVDRQFRTQSGEREADFINCIIWRKSAENFVSFTHKGSKVGIDGRLQTRSYENQQGQRVFITEVVTESFALLDPKNNGQGQQNGGSQYGQNNGYQNQNNQQYGNQGGYQQQNYQGGYDQGMQPDPNQGRPVEDDDLPF